MTRLILKKGAHTTMQQGGCVMEFAAYMAGEAHSDSPQCVSPVIGAFMRRWNDRLNDTDRQQLVPLALTVIGTRTNAADERTRIWMIVDWLTRVEAPRWLRAAKLETAAASLEALPEITNSEIAKQVRPIILAARKKARAATAYATAAAYASAAAAAYASASAAAYAAATAYADAAATAYATAAAYASAAAAAYAAATAYATAAAAADAKLRPMVVASQRSAYDLVERLCAIGRTQEPEPVHSLQEAIAVLATV